MESSASGKELAKGIGVLLFAQACLAFVVLFSRVATQTFPLPVVIFFQNVIAFVIVAPYVLRGSLKTGCYGLILVRIIFGILNFVFLFMSAQKITLTGAILLNNAAPIYVPFVAYLWKRVPINHKLWPGIILGFIGLSLVLNPWAAIGQKEAVDIGLGALFGLLSGFSLSVALVSMRHLHQERMFPVFFYYYLIASVVTLPVAWVQWSFPSLSAAWVLVVIGALTFLTQGGYLKALKYGKATYLSPFLYSAVIYGGLLDWLVYKQVPDLFFLSGVIILSIGGILVIVFSGTKNSS